MNKKQKAEKKLNDSIYAMSRTGMVSWDQAKEYCNMSDYSIKKAIDNNIFESKRVVYKNKVITVLSLASKGQDIARERVDYLYKPSGTKHDLKLSEVFFSLNEEEKKSYRNDIELRKQFGQKGAPDGCYMKNGQLQVVEVITKNYTQEMIEERIEWCQTYLNVEIGRSDMHYAS